MKKFFCLTLSTVILSTNIAPVFANSAIPNKTLEYNLNNAGINLQELNSLKELFNSNINQNERGSKLGVAKEIAKFLIKHKDLIPIKAVREALTKYGGKLIDVIDTLEAYTWYGIASGLEKLGVPGGVANLLADLITFFLL